VTARTARIFISGHNGFAETFEKNSHQLKKREVLWLDFTGRQ
jgi:hypothetical protein